MFNVKTKARLGQALKWHPSRVEELLELPNVTEVDVREDGTATIWEGHDNLTLVPKESIIVIDHRGVLSALCLFDFKAKYERVL